MNLADSAASTRSQANARCAPRPHGRAVHGGDHRFLAVEDGGDQALGAETDRAGHVTGDAVLRRRAAAQIRARTETTAGSGDHHGPYGRVGGGLRQQPDDAFALVRGDGVEGFGAVEGDAADLIVSGVLYQ